MFPGTEPRPYRRRLRADSSFFLELQFCDEHGLPHSKFLAWNEVDRAKALAFVLEKGSRCIMCGTADWEWDPEQGGSKHAYEAVNKFCQGCYTKSVVARDTDHSDGTTIELLPTSGRDAAKRHVAAKRAYLKGSGS